MYPIKSFTVPSKTYNKVSMQHYYIVAPPSFPIKIVPPLPCLWRAMPLQMVTLKYPPHLFASANPKSQKYDKYDKAPYKVPCYH